MIRRISNLPQALSNGDELDRRLSGASMWPSISHSRSIRLLRFVCDELAGRELWPRKERAHVLRFADLHDEVMKYLHREMDLIEGALVEPKRS